MDFVPVELKMGVRGPGRVSEGRRAFGFGSMGGCAKRAGPRGNFKRSIEIG